MLVFFAADNVMAWIASPFIFYPLMLVFGGIALLYSLGLGNQVMFVARHSINMGLSMAHVDFRI